MAARRHWRFVVRDPYGYVIQNAKVSVFQPGTSTAFTGTAYNAASGGSTVTNPFTTNAQGEVEAWFDTAQVVDVEVTDNANLAYRAVGGASDTVDFATFRESDDVYAAASDTPISKATTAEINDITAAAQTEAAGTSNTWADGAHVHGHSAFSANPHGAADHTNLTRSIWLPVHDGVVADGGTLAVRGTAPDALRVITLADAVTSGALWFFMLPDDFAGTSIDIEIWHAGQTTTTGSVRWSVNMHSGTEGTSVVTVQGSATFTGQAPTTADLLVKEALSSLSVSPQVGGDFVRLSVRRLGADGADNYAASTSLIGVRVFYTANQ